MKRLGAFVALCLVVLPLIGQVADPREARKPAPAAAAADPIRFETIDVFIDSGQTPLAAWQVEFKGAIDGGKVELVGIEGGEHAAYAKPAFYDPAALSPAGGGRVILAAFNTGADLPSGRTRVARLHVQITQKPGSESRGTQQSTIELTAAADAQGNQIKSATATVVQGDQR